MGKKLKKRSPWFKNGEYYKKTTWWGGTRTERYRKLDVTETVQNYKNNKPHGKATVKTYQTEEVVK